MRILGHRPTARVAHGGVATVFRAVHRDGGDVALKVAHRAGDPRLRREADALRAIGPRAAPRLHELGRWRGRDVLVLEFVAGERAPATALSADRAADLVAGVARAIDAVHAAGWVHGDVKPANLLVRRDGGVRLVDFGLSCPIGERAAAADRAGTPAYMAPEQCSGRAMTAATDVYALAASAFLWVTGRLPFEGPAAEQRAAHLARRPPRASVVARVPAAVDAVLARGLAKVPDERFARASAFAEALARALRAPMREPRADTATPDAVAPTALAAVRARRGPVALSRTLADGVVAGVAPPWTLLAFPDALGAASGVRRALRACRELAGSGAIDPGATVHVADAECVDGAAGLAVAGAAIDDPAGWVRPDATAVALTPAAARTLGDGATGGPRGDATALGPGETAAAPATGGDRPAPPAPVAGAVPPWVGRREQIDRAVGAVRAAVADGAPALIAFVGGPGAGKTRALDALAARLRDARIPIAPRLGAAGITYVDDAHRAAPDRLAAIAAAVAPGSRTIVAIATDPILWTTRPRWAATAARIERIDLPPLAPADARALARAVLAPAEFVPHALLDALCERAGGIPGLIVELAAAIRATGALRYTEGGGAIVAGDELDTVGATAIARRIADRALAGLPAGVRRFAELCAVVGEPLSPADLDRVCERLDAEAYGGVDARAALERLAVRGLIARAPDGYAFVAPMLRDQIAAGVAPARAAAMHRAARDAGHGDAERRAEHCEAAGDRDGAARVRLELAAAADRRRDDVAAERHYTRALASLADGDPRRASAFAARGRARIRLHRSDDGIADLRAARAAVDERTDPRTALALDLELATALDWAMDATASAAAARRAARLADRLAPAERAAVQPAIDAALGRSAYRADRIDDAIALLSRAVDRGDVRVRIEAGLLLAPALLFRGQTDEARRRYDRVLDDARRADDALHEAAARVNRQMLWLRLDAIDAAAVDLEAAVAIARRIGHPQVERAALHNVAELWLWTGRFEDARRAADRSWELQRRFARAGDLPDDALLVARIAVAQADHDRATRALGWAVRHTRPAAWSAAARLMRSEVELAIAGAGEAAWRAAWDRAAADLPHDDVAIEFAVVAAECAAARRDTRSARAWCAEARRRLARSPAWRHRLDALAQAVDAPSTSAAGDVDSPSTRDPRTGT